ncbi:hypothetical protein SOP93_04385 [Peribacillus frigoritolerans]|uniref:hypothetical protein n=1 Tax=Peribacillus frigoritolerans TaxID=450367 RepID=UPI002B24D864|nr:hypothetical protein [Peribacillus frigoritolerans]MEB2490417.1 hypothetical protein [Peribacillus frigoritolerans]
MFFFYNPYGIEEIATHNNWLAETPQALLPRRLGRQSAERERISEINWSVFLEKTVGGFPIELCLRLGPLNFFPVILIGWKKYARLLPKNWLAETPQALAPRRLGRQSVERERISEINRTIQIKNAGKLDFH